MPTSPATYTARDIFHQADAFFTTAHFVHTKSDPQSIRAMTAPLIVITAFTCELMFKCLVMIEQGKPPKSHGLFDLFDKLTEQTKASLSKAWDAAQHRRAAMLDNIDKQMGKKNPRDLASNLKTANESFVLMRYLYEGGKDFDFFISDLPLVLRTEIERKCPEWFFTPPQTSPNA